MATTGDAALDRVLRALHALGDDRAARLVEDCWARAEEEVAETLTSAMRAVLLRAAAARLEGAPEAEAPPSSPPAPRQEPLAAPAQEPPTAPDPAPPAAEARPHRPAAPAPPAAEARPHPPASPASAEPGDPRPLDPTSSAEASPAPIARLAVDEGWYVYGVVPADGAVELAGGRGVDPDREVHAVAAGGLAAIAGPVALADFAPEALRDRLSDRSWMADRVLAHEAVLRRCVEAGPVVPMRFATVVTDERAVRSFLGEHGTVLADALERLRGRQEWGAKAYVDWTLLRAHLGAEGDQPSAGEQSAGAAYFTRKREERQGRARAQEVARELARDCHDRLSELAELATLLDLREPEEGEPEGTTMVLNGAFLVLLDRVAELEAVAAALSEEHAAAGFRVEVTGPWPPYSFVDLSAREAAG